MYTIKCNILFLKEHTYVRVSYHCVRNIELFSLSDCNCTFSFFLKHEDISKYTDKITKICMQKRKKKGKEKKSSFTLQCKYCLIVRRVT